MRRVAKALLGGAMVLVIAWLGGFLWFVADLGPPRAAAGTQTDAIVVLTGGSERVESGLALLAAGKARKLFISGVHPSVTVGDLTRGGGTDPRLVQCCIVLGHGAGNTAGNALETAEWLNAEHYHSLRLVTADYHMRRAVLEFHRALPGDVLIVPDPVVPGAPRREGTPGWRSTIRVVIVEYMKYLAALGRSLVEPNVNTVGSEEPGHGDGTRTAGGA